MNTTVNALKNLYVAFGGELTDTYADIADGVPVSDYVVTPDVINAIAQKVTANAAETTETTENTEADAEG